MVWSWAVLPDQILRFSTSSNLILIPHRQQQTIDDSFNWINERFREFITTLYTVQRCVHSTSAGYIVHAHSAEIWISWFFLHNFQKCLDVKLQFHLEESIVFIIFSQIMKMNIIWICAIPAWQRLLASKYISIGKYVASNHQQQ